MDDPTRWCENDTGNETRPSGPRIPSRGPFSYEFFDFLTAVHYSNKPAKPSRCVSQWIAIHRSLQAASLLLESV